MTVIQEQAIQLIQQLPDDKIQAIITLATDEIHLLQLKKYEKTLKKQNAIHTLDKLISDIPEISPYDELDKALEEKYGSFD